MTPTLAFAALDAESPLAPFHFDRRALRSNDVEIEILYCGVCHTDLHQARNDWKNSAYPMVPGHEIVGQVSAVGPQARRFKPGDKVAVGCMVDSCQQCDQCAKGEEQLCRKRSTLTYNDKDRVDGTPTFGGYASHIVVREEFVLSVPGSLDLARAAPLLCAGITTWTPLKEWNAGPGTRVGVVGLGGLGHMAVKLAVGLGADVTVITTSPSKEKDALALGAHRVLLSREPAAMKQGAAGFDLIIDTVPVGHDITPYMALLDVDGSLVVVGAVDMLPPIHSGLLMGGRKRLAGSGIGGIARTQELLDFCGERGILPETETIAIQQINHAYERMERSDVKYRFVIDSRSLAAA